MIFTYGYLFYLPINLIYAVVILFFGKKKKKDFPYYIFAVIFAVYQNAAIDLVYFPLLIVNVKEWGSISNFVDLSLNFMEMGGIYQVVGNILLTVPLGILLPFILDIKPWPRRILTLIVSAFIEIVQFFIIYFFHTVSLFFDVKDIILNICGGIIGIIIFEIVADIVRKKLNRFSDKNKLFHYIYEICQ